MNSKAWQATVHGVTNSQDILEPLTFSTKISTCMGYFYIQLTQTVKRIPRSPISKAILYLVCQLLSICFPSRTALPLGKEWRMCYNSETSQEVA